MTRQDLVLSAVDWHKGSGLEIGPLTSPILSKAEARIFYADHMSQAGLREKYKDAPLDIKDIVPVDFVVKDTLVKAVGGKKFDYVIACHVIEHVPDTVRWFQDIAAILKPGGTLALAIPDKRFIFDIERNPSRPADIIGAYLDRFTHPSSTMMYDYATEGRGDIDAAKVWKNPHQEWHQKPHLYSQDEAYKMCLENIRPGGYVDCHCHVFTPASFIEIMRALMQHGLFDYKVEKFTDTNDQNIEFYVSLRKLRKGELSLKRQLATLPKPDPTPTLNTLQLEKKALRAKITSLQEELVNIQSSKSWKLTSPLRKVMHRLAGLKSSVN